MWICCADFSFHGLTYMHDVTGLPWYLCFAGATVFARACLFPLMALQQRTAMKSFNMMPKIAHLQEQVSNVHIPMEQRREVAQQIKAIKEKEGVKMRYIFLPILGQMPVFISFFFGIRYLAHVDPSMMTGGALWFENLATRDETFILPIMSSMTFLANIELNRAGKYTLPQSPAMVTTMRAIAPLMVIFTGAFPKGVFIYWVTNNLVSVVQTALFQNGSFRRLCGMPTPDPEAVRARQQQMSAGTQGFWQKMKANTEDARGSGAGVSGALGGMAVPVRGKDEVAMEAKKVGKWGKLETVKTYATRPKKGGKKRVGKK